MPAIELANRKQTAVLWAATAATGFDDYGRHKVTAATQIKVRWEEKNTEVVDANGNTVAIDVVVVVDRVVLTGSIMWLGKKDDLASPPVDLNVVVNYSAIPDVKGRITRRVVMLRRYNDKIPTIAS